ncbi:uncharacterized protein ACHE_10963S [Aspergillus chevalieri]|uniref:Uncharacterized protein n=1 Tax=Aspergillus chevalieri TaxID=182096 RepID=A0A7R7VF94_ASPCH|nr:uncharacterized protein ACHE_10963S [Aspergillus chevalieri]BCR83561.1 hypothetical protein ACHE_10963S [Aspergillus chevalieri]
MHESNSGLWDDLPAKCASICNTLKTKDHELRNTHAQLVNNIEITEVLFELMWKMRTLLSSYEQEQKQGLDLESAFELAEARLKLQSLELDCDTLRQENSHLREVLQTQHVKG